MPAMARFVHLNGSLVPEADARLHVSDLGLRRAYSAFEFLRVDDGVPVFFEDHLERFERSCAALELTPPSDVERRVLEVLRANNAVYSGVSLYLTGGYSPDGFTPSDPNFVIMESPREPYPAQMYTQGTKVITYQHTREMAHAKTTDYLTAVRLSKTMREAGATEVIFTTATQALEGARAAFGAVLAGDVIVAPVNDVLESVTLGRALNLARGFARVERRAITLEEFHGAKELFLTSATRGVMPVTTVDDRAVGDGAVGALTTRLMRALEVHTRDYIRLHAPLETAR
jgi:D-alanine transaminase/branched-chain amino acid aminotransferase